MKEAEYLRVTGLDKYPAHTEECIENSKFYSNHFGCLCEINCQCQCHQNRVSSEDLNGIHKRIDEP